MKDQFDQIRQQINEIRNFIGPLDHKLEGLDYQITRSRISFEVKALEIDAKVTVNSSEIAKHSEELKQIRNFIKMPESLEIPGPGPVHQDKLHPSVLPPQNPPA